MNGVGLGARAITSLASEKNDKQPAQLFNTDVTALAKAAYRTFYEKHPGSRKWNLRKKKQAACYNEPWHI